MDFDRSKLGLSLSGRRFRLALTAIALLAVALAACQEGEPELQGPPAIDLARQDPALSLLGAQAGDKVRAVAASDVNGDGHQDFIACGSWWP